MNNMKPSRRWAFCLLSDTSQHTSVCRHIVLMLSSGAQASDAFLWHHQYPHGTMVPMGTFNVFSYLFSTTRKIEGVSCQKVGLLVAWNRNSLSLGPWKLITSELRVLVLTKRHVGSRNEIDSFLSSAESPFPLVTWSAKRRATRQRHFKTSRPGDEDGFFP